MATPVYDNANYDITTDIGKLRMMVSDNAILDTGAGAKPDGTFYSDEELQVFIDLAGSWKRAVSLVLRALANAYARQAIVQEIDGYREDLSKISAQLQDAATKWDKQLDTLASVANDAAVSWAGCFGFDTDGVKIFGIEQYGAKIANAT